MFSLNVKVMINKVHGTQIWLPYFNMQINQYANLHVPQHVSSTSKSKSSSLQHPNQSMYFNLFRFNVK